MRTSPLPPSKKADHQPLSDTSATAASSHSSNAGGRPHLQSIIRPVNNAELSSHASHAGHHIRADESAGTGHAVTYSNDLSCFKNNPACPHCGQGQCRCPTRLAGNCPAVAVRRDHYNGRAFMWASSIYLAIAAVTVFALTSRAEEKPLELGGSTAVITLDQFGDHAQANIPNMAPPALQQPEPEPEPVKDPEPEKKPEPEVKKLTEEPHAAPPVKKERERKIRPEHKVKPEPKERHQEKRDRPQRKEREHKAERRDHSAAHPHQASGGRRGGSPQTGKVMVFGRDNHPVLLKIKQAIDSNLLYPRRARMMREEGAAIVQFTWTSSGQLERLRLLRSTGSRELDEAAVQTIVRASASFPKVSHNFTLRLPILFRLTD